MNCHDAILDTQIKSTCLLVYQPDGSDHTDISVYYHDVQGSASNDFCFLSQVKAATKHSMKRVNEHVTAS